MPFKLKNMKHFITGLLLMACSFTAHAQEAEKPQGPDPQKPVQVVEASCGQCNFNMEGDGCQLAVRINGKPYWVDGTSIDQHGDAHGKDGFCNKIRKAEVQGIVTNGRFMASYFKLLPANSPKKKK